jgi:GTP-binding protein HflX
VPYDRGDVLAALHRAGEVLTETAEAGGVRVSARVGPSTVSRYAEFVPGGAPT